MTAAVDSVSATDPGDPDISGPAGIVERDDPRLFATTLFAAERAQPGLLTLYAFDIEISRAAAASDEPLIPYMRLQWWRDIAEAAQMGAPAPAHEVAGPFTRLIVEQRLPVDLIEAMITAREIELAGDFDHERFHEWADGRFGALTALAALLLTGEWGETAQLARKAGPVLGAAFVLRHAVAMAGEDRFLLPGLAVPDRASLARGEAAAGVVAPMRRFALEGLEALALLRADRNHVERRAIPAFLPLMRAERLLKRALRLDDAAGNESAAGNSDRRSRLFGGAPTGLLDLDRDQPFDGLRLAMRAFSGRW